MKVQLCESRWCLPPTGDHRTYDDPADHDPACRGCLSALADDGLRLCRYCTHRIAVDVFKAAALHRALGQALAGAGRSSDTIGTITREPGFDLDPALVEIRDDIRAALADVAVLIAGQRGISLPVTWHWDIAERPYPSFVGPMPARRVSRPDRTAPSIAGYIAHHRTWLAAHRRAGEIAADLRDLATNDRAWRLAYPTSGRGRVLLGLCPEPVDEQPCGGRIYAAPTDAAVQCRRCLTVDTIEGWWHRINAGAGLHHLVDAYYAAARLSAVYGHTVDPASIRKWGQRSSRTGVAPVVSLTKGTGRLLRDTRGRVLYRWPALAEYAERLYAVSATDEDEAA